MKMKKPEMEVVRFEDRDVIATSGYRPNGKYSLTDFLSSDTVFATINSEYEESGGTHYDRQWVTGRAGNIIEKRGVSRGSYTMVYPSRHTLVYTWWDEIDESWRTDRLLLMDYSTLRSDYDKDNPRGRYDDIWPTN